MSPHIFIVERIKIWLSEFTRLNFLHINSVNNGDLVTGIALLYLH